MLINQKVVSWLSLATVLTLSCGVVYVAVQQDLRQTANDPQIQLAEDTAAALASNVSLDQIMPKRNVEISQSLDPYLIVYNNQGQQIGSSATLHGQPPTLPSGVFAAVKQGGEKRFTWQPETGVRSAVVVTSYGGSQPGYVLVGRSLREVEKREDSLMFNVWVVWVVGLVLILIFQFGFMPKKMKVKVESN